MKITRYRRLATVFYVLCMEKENKYVFLKSAYEQTHAYYYKGKL
jgi:hypothetical protein